MQIVLRSFVCCLLWASSWSVATHTHTHSLGRADGEIETNNQLPKLMMACLVQALLSFYLRRCNVSLVYTKCQVKRRWERILQGCYIFVVGFVATLHRWQKVKLLPFGDFYTEGSSRKWKGRECCRVATFCLPHGNPAPCKRSLIVALKRFLHFLYRLTATAIQYNIALLILMIRSWLRKSKLTSFAHLSVFCNAGLEKISPCLCHHPSPTWSKS